MSGSHEREHAAIGAKISSLPAMHVFRVLGWGLFGPRGAWLQVLWKSRKDGCGDLVPTPLVYILLHMWLVWSFSLGMTNPAFCKLLEDVFVVRSLFRSCQCFAVSCCLVGFGFAGFSADFVAWVQDGAVPLLRFMVTWCLVL
ncbi:hypothetical protein U1Q18_031958, partial [Sarracenia purpurea var. burkii]